MQPLMAAMSIVAPAALILVGIVLQGRAESVQERRQHIRTPGSHRLAPTRRYTRMQALTVRAGQRPRPGV